MSIANNEQRAIFEACRTRKGEVVLGEIGGIWAYYKLSGDLDCFSVRYEPLTLEDKKEFRPFSYINGTLTAKYPYDVRPIYNLKALEENPSKLVLIVEGEKTADIVQSLFPEYVVITWLGGSSAAKSADLTYLKGRKICLWPDKDIGGYKAMETLKDRLQWISSDVSMTNPRSLNVIKPSKKDLPNVDKNNCGWDLADLDIEHGEYDFDYIRKIIEDSFICLPEFENTSYPHLSKSKNSKPLDTTINLKHLLDHYNIQVEWNMMKREREIAVPNKDFYFEERLNDSLTYITNLAVLHDFNVRRIDRHLDSIALENIYHPVRNWILSRPLDNHGSFEGFLKVLKTKNDQLSQLLLKRWMMSAIAALFNEGEFVAQGVLVLQGTGGWYKTSFLASLAPEELGAIKKGSELDPSNKDNLIRLARYWIAELGELGGTFSKSDINKLKAHITQNLDEARKAYAAKDSQMIRRTVYAATVNEENFLVDQTGNRRWWVISLDEPIDMNLVKEFDMQQVWREAYEIYSKGERAYLDNDELNILNASNRTFERIDPFEEKLDSHFDWTCPERDFMTCTEILSHIGYDKPAVGDPNKMSTILTKRGIKKGTGRQERCFYMPRSKFEKQKCTI